MKHMLISFPSRSILAIWPYLRDIKVIEVIPFHSLLFSLFSLALLLIHLQLIILLTTYFIVSFEELYFMSIIFRLADSCVYVICWFQGCLCVAVELYHVRFYSLIII